MFNKEGGNTMWLFTNKNKSQPEDFKYKYFANDKISQSPSYDLDQLYERCVEEMTLQQSKRDQVFTVYLAMFSFLVPFALSTAGITYVAKGVIFLALAIIGWMFALIIERYRIYKESYWLCCQTITNLMSFKEGSLDKRTVQAVYYRCIFKKGDKYLNKKKNKFRRLFFYKSNIFSGETIYYLIHSFITSVMVYLGIYQIFEINPHFSALSLHITGGAIAFIFFIGLTVFYFEKLLEIYSVLCDETGDAFNIAFSKAWFLHFYVEKSPFELATASDIEGEVLKGVVPYTKSFFHHLNEGEILENDGQDGAYKIIIVAKGAITVDGRTVKKHNFLTFTKDNQYTIKADADATLVEMRIKNVKEEPKIKTVILKEGEKTQNESRYDIQRFIYTFDDNKCRFIIDEENVYFDSDVLFHSPYGKAQNAEALEEKHAHYLQIDIKI